MRRRRPWARWVNAGNRSSKARSAPTLAKGGRRARRDTESGHPRLPRASRWRHRSLPAFRSRRRRVGRRSMPASRHTPPCMPVERRRTRWRCRVLLSRSGTRTGNPTPAAVQRANRARSNARGRRPRGRECRRRCCSGFISRGADGRGRDLFFAARKVVIDRTLRRATVNDQLDEAARGVALRLQHALHRFDHPHTRISCHAESLLSRRLW